MKTLKIAAAIVAASASAFTFAPAFAQDSAASAGHYEWRAAPQYGPRAPLQTSKRVWVPDHAQMANCNCDMMKMSAADCMKEMHGMMSPSGASAG
ncbi:hypothetical protein [Sphingobium sp. YG1]|uniref:hypothetical protein n=1 Tax=Sphingobium sp. YG1 TaxID=2082188 RepID=UPI000E7427E7|nr:hypothetical protein [Sphingobium sp. YG1]|tara:strand:+ start:356 stop:640 length:285 start_codon:yes stop_codon:yes gene_type:complete